jgi:hypothetical protein
MCAQTERNFSERARVPNSAFSSKLRDPKPVRSANSAQKTCKWTTLHQWARPKEAESLLTIFPRAGRTATVPFIGFAEAFVLSALRRAGVPMQRIRPAVAASAPRSDSGSKISLTDFKPGDTLRSPRLTAYRAVHMVDLLVGSVRMPSNRTAEAGSASRTLGSRTAGRSVATGAIALQAAIGNRAFARLATGEYQTLARACCAACASGHRCEEDEDVPTRPIRPGA